MRYCNCFDGLHAAPLNKTAFEENRYKNLLKNFYTIVVIINFHLLTCTILQLLRRFPHSASNETALEENNDKNLLYNFYTIVVIMNVNLLTNRTMQLTRRLPVAPLNKTALEENNDKNLLYNFYTIVIIINFRLLTSPKSQLTRRLLRPEAPLALCMGRDDRLQKLARNYYLLCSQSLEFLQLTELV